MNAGNPVVRICRAMARINGTGEDATALDAVAGFLVFEVCGQENVSSERIAEAFEEAERMAKQARRARFRAARRASRAPARKPRAG